jgi:hypothetical protein
MTKRSKIGYLDSNKENMRILTVEEVSLNVRPFKTPSLTCRAVIRKEVPTTIQWEKLKFCFIKFLFGIFSMLTIRNSLYSSADFKPGTSSLT